MYIAIQISNNYFSLRSLGFLCGFHNPKSNEGEASSLVRSNSQEEEWDYCEEDDCEDK